MFYSELFWTVPLLCGVVILGSEICNEGEIALNTIKFRECKHDIYRRYSAIEKGYETRNFCRYAESQVNNCSIHYRKCNSDEDLTKLMKFWLNHAVGNAYLFDKDADVTKCGAYSPYFSMDELNKMQTELPKYPREQKCEYKLEYLSNADPEYNELDDVFKCQNICKNTSIITEYKDTFDDCTPGTEIVRETLMNTTGEEGFNPVCKLFEKVATNCSDILDTCLSSTWKEFVISEELYAMALGVLNSQQNAGKFQIEDCSFFGGDISYQSPLGMTTIVDNNVQSNELPLKTGLMPLIISIILINKII